ncbi:Threonylcarbamoyl-AMP synthase, partial [Clarias magur]
MDGLPGCRVLQTPLEWLLHQADTSNPWISGSLKTHPSRFAAHCCLVWWRFTSPNYLFILTCDLCSYPSVSAKHHVSLVRFREAQSEVAQLLIELTSAPTTSSLEAE